MLFRKYSFGLILLMIAALPSVAQQDIGDPSATLTSLEQTAQSAASDISHLRIEKWKLDSKSKADAQGDRESLLRNLNGALPALVAKVRQTPANLSANFELYRNLEVLSMIFARFAETTGAFGSHDEYASLSNDVAGFDTARKALTGRMEALMSSAQTELTRYRTQAKAAQTPVAPAKKLVIDDSEPAKPVAKKKKTPPKKDPNGTPATSAAAPKQ